MPETVTMPKLGFDMAEGTLVRWVIAEGASVNKGDVLAEIETDKATVEVQSTFGGVVARHLVDQGSVVPVGTPIAIVAAPGEEVKLEPAPKAPRVESGAKEIQPEKAEPRTSPVAVVPAGGPIKASPLAKRMAGQSGLDLGSLRGTGPGGRIVRRDVEEAMHAAAPVEAIPAGSGGRETTWQPGAVPADEKVPLNRLRSAIGRRMVEAKQQVPHFYVTHLVDVDALLRLRAEFNAMVPEDQKLSVNDFIIKAVGLSLRQYPNLNASLQGDAIIRHGHVNIGVAVAVEGGLLTVVCRDADQKPLRKISGEIRALAGRARAGKVRPDDIEGSTFSISNLGMFDVEHFIAIINPPEAAILAVGSAREMAVSEGGILKTGQRMNITISADHRITDGAEAAQFLQAVARRLETPLGLLLE